MAAFTPDQQKFIDFVFRTLNNRIADVHGGIYRTRRELIALAVLLSRKGIDITAEELEAAAKELEAGHQVDMALDSRVQRGEELISRMLRGEDIPQEEMNQWLRDVEGRS